MVADMNFIFLGALVCKILFSPLEDKIHTLCHVTLMKTDHGNRGQILSTFNYMK